MAPGGDVICPNCKTELVEVNGRYICSDCGREIPENEVMASDWGNGGTTRAGLYGAGTDDAPEEGSKPINDYDTSLTESESEITPQPATVTTVAEMKDNEPSVDEILQSEAPTVETSSPSTPDTGFYTPEKTEKIAASVSEAETPITTQVVTPELDTPVAETPEIPVTPIPEVSPVVIPAQEPESSSRSFSPSVGQAVLTQDDGKVESFAPTSEVPETAVEIPIESVAPSPEVQEIPVTIPEVVPEPIETAPEVAEIPVQIPVTQAEDIATTPTSPEMSTEQVPQHSEEVRDMFEGTDTVAAPLTQDPGIYSDPMYENNQIPNQPQQAPVATNVPMAKEKRLNLIILISGIVLLLLLVAGGVWGYFALNAKVEPVTPTPGPVETTWVDYQSVDGGFKISYPGQPEKSESTAAINGVDSQITTSAYSTGDSSYLVNFATLTTAQAKSITDDLQTTLPVLVGELAKTENLTVSDTKIGKYYDADAIDFKLASDTASFQGKIMIKGNIYILVMAGSTSSQTVEYDKFIKSFSFITAESNN